MIYTMRILKPVLYHVKLYNIIAVFCIVSYFLSVLYNQSRFLRGGANFLSVLMIVWKNLVNREAVWQGCSMRSIDRYILNC